MLAFIAVLCCRTLHVVALAVASVKLLLHLAPFASSWCDANASLPSMKAMLLLMLMKLLLMLMMLLMMTMMMVHDGDDHEDH